MFFCYLLIPAVYLVYLALRRKAKLGRDSVETDRRLLLLTSVGIFLAIGVSAPTAYRLGHVAIPGVVILVWLLSQIQVGRLAALSMAALLTIVGGLYIVQRQVTAASALEMPAGRTRTFLPNLHSKGTSGSKNILIPATLSTRLSIRVSISPSAFSTLRLYT